MKLFHKYRQQNLTFLYFSLGIFLLTLGLTAIDPSPFIPYLGNIDPRIAFLITAFSALVLFYFLLTKTPFKIYKKRPVWEYTIIAAIAVLFGIEVIAADIWLVDYSSEINVPFPKSLLFYPSIGYFVEVFFHLFPLTLIIFVLSAFRKLRMEIVVRIGIVAVAVIEPLYQVGFTDQHSFITSVYTAIHVFLFSLTQLWIFKRFDFLSMYLLRMLFYAIWHILWGHMRLEVLYSS